MSKSTNKQSKSTKAPKAEVVELVKEERHEWGGKHACCKECGTTELKHYSGGSCTRCYTEARNKKLGLGTYNPETRARKLERVEARMEKLEAELAELRAKKAELSKKSA